MTTFVVAVGLADHHTTRWGMWKVGRSGTSVGRGRHYENIAEVRWLRIFLSFLKPTLPVPGVRVWFAQLKSTDHLLQKKKKKRKEKKGRNDWLHFRRQQTKENTCDSRKARTVITAFSNSGMVTPVYKRPLGASGMKGVRDTTTTKHNTTEEVAEETIVVSMMVVGWRWWQW